MSLSTGSNSFITEGVPAERKTATLIGARSGSWSLSRVRSRPARLGDQLGIVYAAVIPPSSGNADAVT
jgi:hypothetical protein